MPFLVWSRLNSDDLQLLHEGIFDLIEKMVSIWGMPDEIDVKLLEQQVALGQHIKFSE
jgi:hypothetical protein